VPIYTYRCGACDEVTETYASVRDAPRTVRCEHCGADGARRIISSVAYHASEAAKTSRLDPKYEKMVDAAYEKSASADPNRLLKKMKPFSDSEKGSG